MDPEGIAMSKRRITLSTAGVVPQIEVCGRELGVNLAISLHAVTDELRDTLVPINKKWPISELLKACKEYPTANNARRITFEYVMLKGINDSEDDFNQWSNFIEKNNIDFRYIELMQTGDNLDYFKKYHVPATKFTNYLKKNDWIIQTFGRDAGPAKNYLNPKFKGKFGVIAPYSKDFCKSCNRLRITAKGDLRLCLFGNTGINIRHLMQNDEQIEELKDLILKQLNFKKESHYLELGETGLTKNLSTTGG